MLPVLFSIAGLSVSSFGVFLGLGFLLGIFLVWRLARAWDLNEEKILDLMLLTFLGGMLGARIYFAIENWHLFSTSLLNLILINKVSGFSFWGGFLGGWLTLYFFAWRKRLDFWQIADIALVGLLGGLVLAELGCFLGGCNIGTPVKAFFSVNMVGVVGKRWPVQIIEAVLLAILLSRIWSQATHFHQRGTIVGLGFLLIGVIQLVLQPLKQNHSEIIFSGLFAALGLTILYMVTKQNPLIYFRNLIVFPVEFIKDAKVRKGVIQFLYKSWYNHKTTTSWKLRNLKKFLRRSNVKFS